MASIKKRPDGRYRARYRDPDGREHARHFVLRKDAERWLDSVRGDLVAGTYVDPDAGRRTFGSYAVDWQACQTAPARPSTRCSEALRIRMPVRRRR